MMKFRNLSLIQVQKLAQDLAKKTKHTSVTIGLIGSLGSGKTTFAKAYAKSLGIKSLKSPTFIVSQRYTLPKTARHAKHGIAGGKFLYHLDFYRLDNQKQLNPIGLQDALNDKNIVVIEWADKFASIKRVCGILISFKIKANDKRDVEIKYNK